MIVLLFFYKSNITNYLLTRFYIIICDKFKKEISIIIVECFCCCSGCARKFYINLFLIGFNNKDENLKNKFLGSLVLSLIAIIYQPTPILISA